MSRVDELLVEIRRSLADAAADPDADEQVKKARAAQGLKLLAELAPLLRAQAKQVQREAHQNVEIIEALIHATEGERWRAEELAALNARVARGEASQQEAEDTLLRLSFASDAGRLVD
jgi:hypothetical protein